MERESRANLYTYQITGYYFAGDERKHFEDVVMATNNFEAMQIAIGIHAWAESLEGKTFKLDVIHYECW